MPDISFTITNTINYEEVVGYEPDDPTLAFPSIYGNANFGYTAQFEITPADEENTFTIISTTCTSFPEFVIQTSGVSSARIERNSDIVVFPGESYEFVEYPEDNNSSIIPADPTQFPEYPEEDEDFLEGANNEFISPDDEYINTSQSLFPNLETEYGMFESLTPENANNANQETSVFAWITPPVTILDRILTFSITYVDDITLSEETISVSYDQQYHWNWVNGAELLESLVERSKY